MPTRQASAGRYAGRRRDAWTEATGQATVVLVAALMAIVAGAVALGAFSRAVGVHGSAQRAADLGALAGAHALYDAYPRLFAPAVLDGVANPQHLDKAEYLALGRAVAERVARANGGEAPAIDFPDGATFAPVQVRVEVARRLAVGDRDLGVRAVAVAELAPGADGGLASGGGYSGP